jgi:Raf kinase inhibitor-like YbhB/YbcL family protein
MSEFSISSEDFKEGEEIPKNCGYKHGNKQPQIDLVDLPAGTTALALIMDDPDAMGAVGKVWVHWLSYRENMKELKGFVEPDKMVEGKTDFGEIGYGGPAPPDKRHTYVFKVYALDAHLADLKEGYSKQELEDAMEGFIIAKAKLTGTYAP